jgi:hypothetical protein
MSGINRRRAARAVAPVAGLLAAGLLVWQGSYAAFSASTDNTGDAWSTGNLALQNNGGTATFANSTTALFNGTAAGQPENNIKPGATGTKCITVSSTGSLAGSLRLYRGTISGTNSAALAPQLSLTVDVANLGSTTGNVQSNCTGFPTTGVTNLHTGVALSSLPSTYGTAAAFAVPGGTQRVAYRIAWTFNSTGSNPGDNALQSSSAATDLTWEIQ